MRKRDKNKKCKKKKNKKKKIKKKNKVHPECKTNDKEEIYIPCCSLILSMNSFFVPRSSLNAPFNTVVCVNDECA